ncbi:hypothetical protein BJQ90_01973 [Arthrobacter sp. SO3]|nr:hypothetical protein [Arthrobacter sp. SO3]
MFRGDTCRVGATAAVAFGEQEFRAARLLMAAGPHDVTGGMNLEVVGM